MNQAKTLLTINYRLDAAERFISDVSGENYYLFVGNHIDTNNVVQPYDNAQDTLLSAYYSMIFGKKINSNDTNLMIRRIDWESGIVYDTYSHDNPMLYASDFYVIIEDGDQFDVFKCLENGDGSPSTVAPSRSNVSVDNDDFYYPTDGYRWKYMYSVSSATEDKFATSSYFPVVADEGVKGAALSGAIDVIKVTTAGVGYANYMNGTFGVGDIRLNGDPKIYGISVPNINTTNSFYNSCYIYISSGPGAGQYRMIESYTSNSTYNFIELTEAFDSSDNPENGSVFEIYPSVDITGDGSETTAAKARAIIDPSGNTVARVEILNKGKNYNLASARVVAASSVGVTSNAFVVPVYSPKNGHGYNPPAELGSKFAGVSVTISGSESNTIVTGNDYSQIGLIKNPQFNKITLELDNNNRDFSTNEFVYKVDPVQLAGTVQTTLNGNNELTTGLTVDGANGHSIVSVGDQILIQYETNYMIANVASVGNTTIVMDKAAIFETGSGSANIYLAVVTSNGLVDGYAADVVDLTETYGTFAIGDKIIGSETGTYGEVSAVMITDVVKSFNTFRQCYQYTGVMTQGEFEEDEVVYQIGTAVSRANIHSVVDDDGTTNFYMTNQIGVFNTPTEGIELTSEINGDSSGAIASLTNKYLPDLVFGSGEVIYVENGESITRSLENNETFKLIFEF